MDKGEASGLLIIPDGFGNDILVKSPTTMTLMTNPAQTILPGILEETLSTFAAVINGAHHMLGPTVQPLLSQLANSEGTPPDELVASVSVAMNQLARRVEPYINPLAIQIETVYIEEATKDRTFAEIFFPSMFFMAIIFTAQSLSDDVWKERLRGTLRRTVSTPGRLSVFLLAKLVASGLVVGIVALVALVVGRWVLFISFSNIPLAIVWATLTGVFMLILFTAIQLMASTQRGGSMLSTAILFPLIMVGGAFFPFEAMPGPMVQIGRLTPNGWAMERFKDIVAGVVEPQVLLTTLASLFVVGIVFYFFCLKRLTAFARG
jgi:ABC-type multidrug transport system permease subunit